MKLLLFPILTSICIVPVVMEMPSTDQVISSSYLPAGKNTTKTFEIKTYTDPGERMSSVVFKNQDYCRAELLNFEFDARFYIVSATVYFSGTNFKGVEKGAIASSSLKPIKHLMAKCLPGSTVVFDDVKVKGPDNAIRTIPGVSLLLY